jgi:hypothetical protein
MSKTLKTKIDHKTFDVQKNEITLEKKKKKQLQSKIEHVTHFLRLISSIE